MIYLNNSTEQQECWIPRQDVISGHSGGGCGSYQEGYEDGYDDGTQDQKDKLAATAFTENGEYSRVNGWSAVTVNVPQSGSVLEDKEIVVSQDITVVTPEIGYDGFSAVTVDATEYGQTNYDRGFDDGFTDGYSSGSSEGYDSGYTEGYQSGSTDGFNSGYTSGETHQKSLLVTTAFTENGTYTRENGWNGVTVNVDTASTYDSGYTSGYTSGHTDGVYEEKAKLSATTFTANTAVTISDGGYSAITVNVPQTGHTDQELEESYESGYTEGMEDQKALLVSTAFTENGNYSRENGWNSVSVNVDTASTYNSGYTSGYTSGHTDGVSEEKAKMSAVTFTENTAVTLSDGSYSAVTVNVPQTGHTDEELEEAFNSGYTSGENNVISTFSSITITENGQYGSSAHPLSSITVNVPTSGGGVKYLEYIETDGTQIGWDTGYNIGTDINAKIYLDFTPISGNGYGDVWFAYYGDCSEYVLFRRSGNNSSIGFMFGNNRRYIDRSTYSVVNGNRYLISLDKNGITDENDGTLLVAASSSAINSTKNLYLNCEGLDGNTHQITRCIRARYYSFRVENGNGKTALDMRPCLDENDVPCFYDEVSKQYIYHSGSGTPIAGPTISGNTEGYNIGYTDGIAYQKSLLGELTATTNGSFSAENGYSAITVNVPQSGTDGNNVSGTTAFTSNGIYTNVSGWSAVTVSVPQGGSSTGTGYMNLGKYKSFGYDASFIKPNRRIELDMKVKFDQYASDYNENVIFSQYTPENMQYDGGLVLRHMPTGSGVGTYGAFGIIKTTTSGTPSVSLQSPHFLLTAGTWYNMSIVCTFTGSTIKVVAKINNAEVANFSVYSTIHSQNTGGSMFTINDPSALTNGIFQFAELAIKTLKVYDTTDNSTVYSINYSSFYNDFI